MVRKFLVNQCCKSEVFGLYRAADDFAYNFPHHLRTIISCIIRGLISSIVFIRFFVLLEKWVIFSSMLCTSWLIVKIYWVWSWLWYILTFRVWIALSIHNRRICCFWIIYIVIIMFCEVISMWCFLFIWWFCFWLKCSVILLWVFLSNRGFYCGLYDCLWLCWVFVFGVVRLVWIGEMLCCAVVVIVSTISSLKKWDEVWISCCVRFHVPFKLSWLLKVEFKLLFPALSGKIE